MKLGDALENGPRQPGTPGYRDEVNRPPRGLPDEVRCGDVLLRWQGNGWRIDFLDEWGQPSNPWGEILLESIGEWDVGALADKLNTDASQFSRLP